MEKRLSAPTLVEVESGLHPTGIADRRSSCQESVKTRYSVSSTVVGLFSPSGVFVLELERQGVVVRSWNQLKERTPAISLPPCISLQVCLLSSLFVDRFL